MPKITLKLKYKEEIRRVSLEMLPSYDHLVRIVKELFPALNGQFSLKYVDEDEDLITISSDMELKEATNVLSDVLRISVFDPNSAQNTNQNTHQNTNQNAQQNAQTNPMPNIFSQLFGGMGGPQQQNPINQLAQMLQGLNMNTNSNPQNTENQQPNAEFVQTLLALLPQFWPMITMFAQNLSPAQKQKYLEQLQTITAMPHLQGLLQPLAPYISSITTLLSQQPPNPSSNPSQNPSSNPSQNPGYQNNTHPAAQNHCVFDLDVFHGNDTDYANMYGKRFTCDICENTISNTRYHCNNCKDFDLCTFCHSIPNIHASDHHITEHPAN